MQATVVVLAVYLTRGRIDEPEAVRLERAELEQELARLPPEERAELEQELADDPLAGEPEAGFGKARVASAVPGAVGARLLLFGGFIREELSVWVFGA